MAVDGDQCPPYSEAVEGSWRASLREVCGDFCDSIRRCFAPCFTRKGIIFGVLILFIIVVIGLLTEIRRQMAEGNAAVAAQPIANLDDASVDGSGGTTPLWSD